MKNICILGSTGSVGTQAIAILRERRVDFKLIAISGNHNIDLLYEQAIEFKPKYVAVMDENKAKQLEEKLKIYEIRVLSGMEGLKYICTLPEVEMVITSIVGMIGLEPTIAAIKELKKSNSKILPVDSEHNAILECMRGEEHNTIRKLILTASGGPFRGKKREQLLNVTPEEAIKHPRWNMGKKISVDSATLMNKTLEVIEAHYLFNMDYNDIDVVVHPQSTIHSMVEYIDGSIIAQLSNTSMKHPIQFALDFPCRKSSSIGYLDLINNGPITFEAPDRETFECLDFGYYAGKIGGTMTTVMNAANEEAVKLFLEGKIKFLHIGEIIKTAMHSHTVDYDLTLEKIINIDSYIREDINKMIK
jgi:1-deoxy-D-xylulose-5-phosphate reductoisomerase